MELPRCPACRDVVLRAFQGRLACDVCEGLFLAHDDLVGAIGDLIGQEVELAFIKQRPGRRACPRCGATMTACHLQIAIAGETPRLRPELDRCITDGIWFDADELATILAKLRHAVSGGGGPGGVVAINGRGWGSGWPLP